MVVRDLCSDFATIAPPRFLYVMLDGEEPTEPARRFPVASLRKITADAVIVASVVRAVPEQVQLEVRPMDVATQYDEATVSSVGGATARSYARKVLDLYTTVDALREALPEEENHDMRMALRAIMGLIRGLTVRGRNG